MLPFPVSYGLRNLGSRLSRNLMTVGVIALVVVACSLFLGLISSLKRTLVSTGDPMNLIVLRKGSGNDGSSQMSLTAYREIRFLDGIARDVTDTRPRVAVLVEEGAGRVLDRLSSGRFDHEGPSSLTNDR